MKFLKCLSFHQLYTFYFLDLKNYFILSLNIPTHIGIPNLQQDKIGTNCWPSKTLIQKLPHKGSCERKHRKWSNWWVPTQWHTWQWSILEADKSTNDSRTHSSWICCAELQIWYGPSTESICILSLISLIFQNKNSDFKFSKKINNLKKERIIFNL